LPEGIVLVGNASSGADSISSLAYILWRLENSRGCAGVEPVFGNRSNFSVGALITGSAVAQWAKETELGSLAYT
jgi:hypothetical protein